MDNKKNEKEFGNDVDRLIAGDQLKTDMFSGEDYKKTVKFAGKMLTSRVEPSPEFKENLKQKLLIKLVNQEIETERKSVKSQGFWEIVRNLGPKSPAWRTVSVTVAVSVVALIVVWRTGVFSGQTNPPIMGSLPPITTSQSAVNVQVITSQTEYKSGEPVNMTFTFENKSREPLTLTPYPPEIIIAVSSLRPYKTILGGESRTLSPGEVVEYSLTWDQRDNEGLQVPAGEYIILMLDIELNDGKGIITLSESPHISIIAP